MVAYQKLFLGKEPLFRSEQFLALLAAICLPKVGDFQRSMACQVHSFGVIGGVNSTSTVLILLAVSSLLVSRNLEKLYNSEMLPLLSSRIGGGVPPWRIISPILNMRYSCSRSTHPCLRKKSWHSTERQKTRSLAKR